MTDEPQQRSLSLDSGMFLISICLQPLTENHHILLSMLSELGVSGTGLG